jgi:hypothetical protein
LRDATYHRQIHMIIHLENYVICEKTNLMLDVRNTSTL